MTQRATDHRGQGFRDQRKNGWRSERRTSDRTMVAKDHVDGSKDVNQAKACST